MFCRLHGSRLFPWLILRSQVLNALGLQTMFMSAHYFFYTSFIIHLGMFSYGWYPNKPLPYEAEW